VRRPPAGMIRYEPWRSARCGLPSAETIVSWIGTEAGTETVDGVTRPPGSITKVTGTRAWVAAGVPGAGAVALCDELVVLSAAGRDVVVCVAAGAAVVAEIEAGSDALELAWPDPPQPATRRAVTSPRTPIRNLTLAA
jgi:hypothetical protein